MAVGLGKLDLNCAACNEILKKERGCEQDSPIPDKWQIGEVSLQRCPLKAVDRRVFIYIKAYNFLQHGILPNTGGWLNQPAKFIEAMELIDYEISKYNKTE